MSVEKLERRLVGVIENQIVRATQRGLTTADVENQDFEVTISHHDYARAREAEDPVSGLEELSLRVKESQAPIVAKLEELGAHGTVHALTNAVTTRLTSAQMLEVAELDEVKIIRHEALDPVTCMNESVRVIEAVEAWEDYGSSGRGVRVAVLDSGIDKNHPALFGKVVDEVSTASEPVNVPGNHGTHVAGTIASNDAIHRGVAYQADLINIKVLTAAGLGQPQSVVTGLEQAVRRGAHVANLSLGWSEFLHDWVCNDADCILCQAADNAARLGVTVVVAAGNEGTSAPAGKSNIRHPATARRVITVGAVDKAKVLANFSSIGPSSGRLSPSSPIRLTKPDLGAPGVGINSSILGGGFGPLNGTSMATPHVAGVAALVLERNAGLRPRMVKKLLEDTSEPLAFAPNQVGYGLVNTYAALMGTGK